MKSSDIFTALAVNNNCYKANRPLIPKGIVVHSTGADNPNLSRYVDSPALAGINRYANHFNTATPGGREVCVHAFIGKDIKGEIKIARILPYTMQCWGCGSGARGSYNSSHIQFEICEDSLNDRKYFEKVFSLAAEYCAYLCHEFGLDISSVVSHAEAHKKGYASNHGDCDHWLKKFGKSMDYFRLEVQKAYNATYSAVVNYADEVCQKCGFLPQTRAYLDRYQYADDLWQKLWENMK